MHNWKKILLKQGENLAKAIEVLESEALRIVLVVDDNNKLLGTVTDGDIRRALLRHCSMDTLISTIMSTQPITASVGDYREKRLAIMKSKDILQLPILDVDGQVVGLETLQQLLSPKKQDTPVFLMAGGFGTRLRPLTNDTPKPLLKVGGKPILETIVDQFIKAGFHKFYISTHYMADQVVEYFGYGEKWGVNIDYIHEEKPLGTAGSLSLLPDEAVQQPFIMMNGDLLTKVNLQQLLDFHTEQNCIATMCIREYDFQIPYGVVEQNENRILGIIEKPVHKFFINAGIYVIEPRLVNLVKKDQYIDMPDLLERHIGLGEQVAAFPVHEYWLDVGRIEQYEQANGEAREVFK